MEIQFPIEFIVTGTPISSQVARPATRDEWKNRIRRASAAAIPQPHFASQDRMAITIYNMPAEPMEGDIDNIVKWIVDALSRHIYLDDRQVERIVVQKFEPENVFKFAMPSEVLGRALESSKPLVYIRVSNDPFEELT
jgi:Holliday junction resolvase RusA-like endonuclease